MPNSWTPMSAVLVEAASVSKALMENMFCFAEISPAVFSYFSLISTGRSRRGKTGTVANVAVCVSTVLFTTFQRPTKLLHLKY